MKRPNILLIHTDQQRWDALGCNGNAEIRTPRLDALAAESTCFDNYFVTNPVCMPSRMSLLTGQYPATLGVLSNGPALPENVPTLPQMLRPYGYHTANIGKLHFLPHSVRDHRIAHPDYGFDHLEISDEPGDYEDAYRAWARVVAPGEAEKLGVGYSPAARAWRQVRSPNDPHLAVARGEKRPRAFAGPDNLTHTAFVAEQTIEFLRSTARRPFFCIAGFFSPHAPWVVPQKYLDMYDPASLSLPQFPADIERGRAAKGFDDEALRAAKQGYYASTTEVDYHAGRILDAVDEFGLLDDTIIIFTSDHGEWLGDHLRFGKGYPGHDCITRVPLMIRHPRGGFEAGRRVERFAECVDMLPSLLEMVGIQVPPHVQGLATLAPGAGESGRVGALTEHAGFATLRTERYRYVLRDSGEELLFDLSRPLGDYENVAGRAETAEELARHRYALALRLIQRGRSLPADAMY